MSYQILKFTKRKLALLSLMVVSFGLQAADLKVGYVQVDKILQEAPQTAESGKKLEKEFGPR